MRLLVLGGGGFLGYHAVTEGLAADHEVTVFNRTGTPPIDGVEAIAGDRRDDLSGLRGREWDVVFDTFTDTEPGAPAVRATADLLSGAVGAYGYVSGMSVYAPAGPSVPDESGPVRQAGVEPDSDRLQERSLAKLAGEAAVTAAFDGPALFPRVGIMVGPRSTRFSYWPVRIAAAARGEQPRSILVPGDGERSVQYSDARDIAAWAVYMLASGRGGTFNTVGPGRDDSLGSVLEACCTAAEVDPGDLDFVAVPDELLLRDWLTEVDEEERPLWYPEDQIPQRAIDSAAALAAGLRFRPPAMTAADTLAWAEESDEAALTDSFLAHEQAILAAVRSE